MTLPSTLVNISGKRQLAPECFITQPSRSGRYRLALYIDLFSGLFRRHVADILIATTGKFNYNRY